MSHHKMVLNMLHFIVLLLSPQVLLSFNHGMNTFKNGIASAYSPISPNKLKQYVAIKMSSNIVSPFDSSSGKASDIEKVCTIR